MNMNAKKIFALALAMVFMLALAPMGYAGEKDKKFEEREKVAVEKDSSVFKAPVGEEEFFGEEFFFDDDFFFFQPKVFVPKVFFPGRVFGD
jgi:hypothetical protein